MPETSPIELPAATRFRRLTAFATIALVLTTLRAWLPQTVFPRVPLVAAGLGWPDGVDLLAVGALLGGALLTFTPTRQRFGWFVLAGAFVLAVLADQHRLQPWAYQFALLAVVFAVTADDARQLQLARWLAIAIYLHSAISKLDHAFLHGMGPQLVERMATTVGLDTKWWTDGFRTTLAAALPVGELAIAIGLVLRRSRRTAAWVAVVLHAGLIAILGPWGLAHEWGVVLWNGFLVGETLLLFTPWSATAPSGESASRPSALRLGEAVIGAACLLPFLEPFGLFDHWPAWAVYSERTERVALLLPIEDVDELPRSLREYVSPPDPNGWSRVRIDRWSLESLGVPVYPQERFRLGVAAAVVGRIPEEVPVRVVIDGVPDRWTGHRERAVLESRDAIADRSEAFRLNAKPKPTVWSVERAASRFRSEPEGERVLVGTELR